MLRILSAAARARFPDRGVELLYIPDRTTLGAPSTHRRHGRTIHRTVAKRPRSLALALQQRFPGLSLGFYRPTYRPTIQMGSRAGVQPCGGPQCGGAGVVGRLL